MQQTFRLPVVDCSRGAPMGRHNSHKIDHGALNPEFVLHICPLDSGGYDEGGAYWGQRAIGHNLWRALADESEIEIFFDSKSRKEAIMHVKWLYPSAHILDTPFERLLEEFVQGYIQSAHFTEDDQLGDDASAMELSAAALAEIRKDCHSFTFENEAHLRAVCDRGSFTAHQAGCDFWLARNGHGSDFRDRNELPADVAEALTASARRAGERSLYIDCDRTISYT